MKPLSIGRLALIYLGVSTMILALLGGYLWREIDQTSKALHAHEVLAAKTELEEAVLAVKNRMHTTAEGLAKWDETRQQLAFPEYYTLWRDNRVRDVGLLPATVDSVALYDKNGNILPGANSPDPMPVTLARPAPPQSAQAGNRSRPPLPFRARLR